MTRPRDEQPQPDRAEEYFVARVAAHYAPTPMPPARRVAWEEALWARLRRRRVLWVPALATVAVAVVVTWFTWPGLFTTVPGGDWGGEPHRSTIAMRSSGQWEYEFIYARELTGAAERDESTILPEDYRVIAQVFLDH